MRWEEHRGGTQSIEQNYLEWFQRQGIQAILLPSRKDTEKLLLSTLKPDMIFLSGGNDIHPSNYLSDQICGQHYSRIRDQFECFLLKWAIKNRIPVFAVCRGFQLVNVFFGGKLCQLLSERVPEHSN
jgi:putative glutamine amidotransferase